MPGLPPLPPAAPGQQRWPPDALTLAGLGAGLSGYGSFVPASPTRSTGRFTAAEAPPTSAPASPTRLDGKEFFRTARWVGAAGSQQPAGCSSARLWCTWLEQVRWSGGGAPCSAVSAAWLQQADTEGRSARHPGGQEAIGRLQSVPGVKTQCCSMMMEKMPCMAACACSVWPLRDAGQGRVTAFAHLASLLQAAPEQRRLLIVPASHQGAEQWEADPQRHPAASA